MKKMAALFVMLSVVLTPLFANEKYYCSANQIVLTDSSILVHYLNTVLELDSLAVDQGGIFFTEEGVRCHECHRPLNPRNTCEYHCCIAKN